MPSNNTNMISPRQFISPVFEIPPKSVLNNPEATILQKSTQKQPFVVAFFNKKKGNHGNYPLAVWENTQKINQFLSILLNFKFQSGFMKTKGSVPKRLGKNQKCGLWENYFFLFKPGKFPYLQPQLNKRTLFSLNYFLILHLNKYEFGF